MTNIINNTSLSYTTLTEEVLAWLQNLDDYDKWKDLFAGSDGTILVEMLAAQAANEYFKIYGSRQENFMAYLSKRISAIAIAQNYGYSVTRGTNMKLTINVTPNSSLYLKALTPIGTCGDYDLTLVNNTSFVEGTPVNVDVYIGNVKTQTLTANSENLLTFRFSNNNISDVVQLYLNDETCSGNPLPYSTQLLDLLNDKYVGISNAVGGVDVMYLNTRDTAQYKYHSNSTLTLQYLEYAEVNYSSTTLEFDYGDINSLVSQTNTIVQEETKSIQINGPLYAETNRVICARKDFQNVMKTLNSSFIDANSTDYSNPIVQVTYILNNNMLLTDAEKASLLQLLSPMRCFGVPMCYISDPTVNNFTINTTLKLMNSSNTNFVAEDIVNEVFAQFTQKLGTTIDLALIEHDLEDYDYIKTARSSFATTVWTAKGLIKPGMIISPTVDNGFNYLVLGFNYTTGTTQPVWPTTIGDTVIDNNIEWTCIPLDKNAVPIEWTANTSFNLFDKCVPTVSNDCAYQINRFIDKSSGVEPTWNTTVGEITYDVSATQSVYNGTAWLTVPKVSTANSWQANTSYSTGTVVNDLANAFDVSFQMINPVNRFSVTEPTWTTTEDIFIVDNVIFSKITQNPTLLGLAWDNYATFTHNISLVTS